MKVLEAVGAARAAPCGVVCAASLSLMYSSMHPLGRAVKRLERTLLNFFSRVRVRGGFFGVPEGRFAGDFGAAAGCGWAVLPRNSRVLVWMRVRRGDSAHGGHCRASLAKKFLKKGEKRAKNRKIGVREVPEGGLGAPYIGCAGRFLGLGTRPLAVLLDVRFVRISQLRALAMRSQRFVPLIRELYMEYLPASFIAHLIEVSPLVRPVIL